MRRSERLREPPRDLFASEFVGNQWRRSETMKIVVNNGNRGSTKMTPTCQEQEGESVGKSGSTECHLIEKLQIENGSLLNDLEFQGERLKKLEGKGTESVINGEGVETRARDVDALVKELVEAKRENHSMQLDFSVMLEKLKKQEEELIELKRGVRINNSDVGMLVQKGNELDCEIMEYDKDYPSLGETTIVPEIGQMYWANIARQNRSKDAGLSLAFVQPNSDNGIKMAKISVENVEEEVRRWSKAAVVYVLGTKPNFHAMKGFVERKWQKYGVVNVCLLKTRVFLVE